MQLIIECSKNLNLRLNTNFIVKRNYKLSKKFWKIIIINYIKIELFCLIKILLISFNTNIANYLLVPVTIYSLKKVDIFYLIILNLNFVFILLGNNLKMLDIDLKIFVKTALLCLCNTVHRILNVKSENPNIISQMRTKIIGIQLNPKKRSTFVLFSLKHHVLINFSNYFLN